MGTTMCRMELTTNTKTADTTMGIHKLARSIWFLPRWKILEPARDRARSMMSGNLGANRGGRKPQGGA